MVRPATGSPLLATLAIFAAFACQQRPAPPAAAPDHARFRLERGHGARGRALLRFKPNETFGDVRQTIVDAMKEELFSIELQDPAGSTLVELPRGYLFEEAKELIVVRIDSAARYGTKSVADTAALEAAARADAGSGTVVLLRVADDISLAQVVAAANSLHRAGIGHVVVSLVRSNIVPPHDGWVSCRLPGGKEDEEALVTLSVEWDDRGRPGRLRVLESSAEGFGGAAIRCALWQHASTTRCSGKPPCTQKINVHFGR